MIEELLIDCFAGGGGASCAMADAHGRPVDIAINHDPEAVALHALNHPETDHYCQNIWKIIPSEVINGQPIAHAHFSPDCRDFSKAKGGKPIKKSIRDLAWVVVAWAKLPRHLRPWLITLENVEEFVDWSPLLNGERDTYRKGETFRRFVKKLEQLGYKVDWCSSARACAFGTPTIRKRLVLVAKLNGKQIVWPKPTHAKDGAGGLLPFMTAADCIDWSLPCPSIFLTKDEGRVLGAKRPLAEATMARIGRGVWRFVIDAKRPFIVRTAHGEVDKNGKRRGRGEHSLDEPLPTVCASTDFAMVATYLTKFSENSVGDMPDEPLHTVMAGAPRHGVVAAFLAQHNGERSGGTIGARSVDHPFSTITTTGAQQQIVTSHLLRLKGTCKHGPPVDQPLGNIEAQGNHLGEVRAFLMKYYGTGQSVPMDQPMHTITTKDRLGLVMVHGEPYQIVDIGMRMLTPRELFRAQGFSDDYIIDLTMPNGKRLSKKAQVRMAGNSVCRQWLSAVIAANNEPRPHLSIAQRLNEFDFYEAVA